jgi:hypothetical protein
MGRWWLDGGRGGSAVAAWRCALDPARGLAMLAGSAWCSPAKWLLAVAALACLVELATTAPGLWENLFGARDFTLTQASMSADDPRVELTREFGGALIALAGVAVLWRRERRRAASAGG